MMKTKNKLKNFSSTWLLPTIAVLILTVQSANGIDISNGGMFVFGIFLTLFFIEIGSFNIKEVK